MWGTRGGAEEWCDDAYEAAFHDRYLAGDTGPPRGEQRLTRNGPDRSGKAPERRQSNLGFRPVLVP